jgi:hypothetical protein
MPQKNQMTNNDLGQLGFAEAQVPESSNSEYQCGNAEVIESASEVASTAAPATIASSHLSTKKDADELTAQTTNIQSPQKEGDPPARQGPTGPRTEVGKKRSSKNATKSGIFSRLALLEGESRSELQSMREGLRNALQPGDDFEELLLDKMVTDLWLLRRVYLAEAAEIEKNTVFVEFDRRRKEQKEAEEISQRRQAGQVDVFALESIGLIWNIQNPDILQRCIESLVELRQGIKTNGFDEEQDCSLLKTIYGDADRPHFRRMLQDEYLIRLDVSRATEGEKAREGCPTPEECKQSVLGEIGAEIKRLKQYQGQQELIESRRRKVEIHRQSVPDSPRLDRLLCYKTSLERSFDRTSIQYEHAQRMRKGQLVLPPIKVDISS